jgi:hypothetical protein
MAQFAQQFSASGFSMMKQIDTVLFYKVKKDPRKPVQSVKTRGQNIKKQL